MTQDYELILRHPVFLESEEKDMYQESDRVYNFEKSHTGQESQKM